MEHGLKHISFYVQKHTAALVRSYNLGLVRDKPLGAPASMKLIHNTVATVPEQVTARWQYWAWPVNMVSTHEISLIMGSFKGLKYCCLLGNFLEMKKSGGFHITVLSLYLIEFQF